MPRKHNKRSSFQPGMYDIVNSVRKRNYTTIAVTVRGRLSLLDDRIHKGGRRHVIMRPAAAGIVDRNSGCRCIAVRSCPAARIQKRRRAATGCLILGIILYLVKMAWVGDAVSM